MFNRKSSLSMVICLLAVFFTTFVYAEEANEAASTTIVVNESTESTDQLQACFDQLVDSTYANMVCSYRISAFLIARLPDLQNRDKLDENLQIIDALRVSNHRQKQSLEFARDKMTDAKRAEEVAKFLSVAENLVIFSEQLHFAVQNVGEKGAEAITKGVERFQQAGESLFGKK